MSAIYPELITGREDGAKAGPWTIERGSAVRGQASCNVTERVLMVPLEKGETARVVRAHELMHARVSPLPDVIMAATRKASVGSLTVAEELRVNSLIQRLGFDTDLLMDGTEAIGGQQMAAAGDWNGVVNFLPAAMNTGAEKKYLSAVRKERPEWSPLLRTLQKELAKVIDDHATSDIGATRLNDDGVPAGFASVTVRMAEMIDRTLDCTHNGGPEEARALKRSLQPGGRRPASGHFAELRVAPFEGAPGGTRNSTRANRPSNSGSSVRYPQRALTDPHKRVFAQKRRVPGGIVVIDQSGSMDIEMADLETLVRQHPRALVIGYSHKPGSFDDTPNAWILANRGHLAREIHQGNVGNGVDGPVLNWALKQREGREPIVWLCDGQVTDSNDHPNEALSAECAKLVLENRIQMVREMRDVDATLSRPNGLPSDIGNFGRVGRAVATTRTARAEASVAARALIATPPAEPVAVPEAIEPAPTFDLGL